MSIADDLIKAIRSVIVSEKKEIALHEPKFTGREWEYVKDCLDTGWVSSVGKYVDRFEQDLAEYTGVKRAVAVVNGTAALHVALKLVGVVAGDEVLVPAMTFIATANAVMYCDAVPHFVDCEYKSLGMNPEKLADYLQLVTEMKNGECFNKLTGNRIKAVVPMHVFGHPVDLDKLSAICNHYKIEMVEDIAESLGSFYKGRHSGNWGKVSALSFNGNKVITTGGGGAILTNDDKLGKLAKHITTTAKMPHQWAFVHDQVGYNYRLPNINAALGCAQLEQLPSFLTQKRSLAEKYKEAFLTVKGLSFFCEPEYACSNYWLNVILLDTQCMGERDAVIEKLHEEGIMARPAWTLMHKMSMYENCPRMNLSVAESLEKQIINLPSSVGLLK